jgi:hypothetical protein
VALSHDSVVTYGHVEQVPQWHGKEDSGQSCQWRGGFQQVATPNMDDGFVVGTQRVTARVLVCSQRLALLPQFVTQLLSHDAIGDSPTVIVGGNLERTNLTGHEVPYVMSQGRSKGG